jgi:hypothetical protein
LLHGRTAPISSRSPEVRECRAASLAGSAEASCSAPVGCARIRCD